MIESMFSQWENTDITSKLSLIITRLSDPYFVLELIKTKKAENCLVTKDNLIEAKNLSDIITLNSQLSTIKHIEHLLSKYLLSILAICPPILIPTSYTKCEPKLKPNM